MDEVSGFSVPVHRALTEQILLAGAPRALAIVNGTCQRRSDSRPAGRRESRPVTASGNDIKMAPIGAIFILSSDSWVRA